MISYTVYACVTSTATGFRIVCKQSLTKGRYANQLVSRSLRLLHVHMDDLSIKNNVKQRDIR